MPTLRDVFVGLAAAALGATAAVGIAAGQPSGLPETRVENLNIFRNPANLNDVQVRICTKTRSVDGEPFGPEECIAGSADPADKGSFEECLTVAAARFSAVKAK